MAPSWQALWQNCFTAAHGESVEQDGGFGLQLTSSRYLNERGRFRLSVELINTAMAVYTRFSHLDNELLLADMKTSQLYYYNETTQVQKGIDSAVEARNIREAAVKAGKLDVYHPNRANGFMNLGVLIAGEDPHRAIVLHKKALRIRLGSKKYATEQRQCVSLNYLNLGRCQWMVGDLEGAKTSFHLSLSLIQDREREHGRRFAQ
jgi:hypothetical protein